MRVCISEDKWNCASHSQGACMLVGGRNDATWEELGISFPKGTKGHYVCQTTMGWGQGKK